MRLINIRLIVQFNVILITFSDENGKRNQEIG